MYSSLLGILMQISPLLLLIGGSCLSSYLLKRKLNPNEAYLNEVKEVKKINRLTFVSSIILCIIFIFILLNRDITLLFIPLAIIEIIRNKYILNDLNTKSENTSTRKYILYDSVFQIIVFILVMIYYFILKTVGYILFINSLNF